jgi:beta-lactamase class A
MNLNKSVLTFLFLGILTWSCSTSKKVKVQETKDIASSKPIESDTLATTDTLLHALFALYPQYFDTILKNNSLWQVQVVYTKIDRDFQNRPSFQHYFYNTNEGQYFYPASTVKLPVAVLALQKLNQLNKKGLDRRSMMITEPLGQQLPGVFNEPNSEDGRPTIENYIKQILLVSDNEAFNRLYEFLGQEYINRTLHGMGYDSTQIIHRLSVSLNEEMQRTSNPIHFRDSLGQMIYEQPLQRSNLSYKDVKPLWERVTTAEAN